MHIVFLVICEIFARAHEMLPLVSRQEHGTHGDLRLEAQFTSAWEQSIAAEKPNVLKSILLALTQAGQYYMVQTNLIVI